MFHSVDSYLMEEYVWKMKVDPHSSSPPKLLPTSSLAESGVLWEIQSIWALCVCCIVVGMEGGKGEGKKEREKKEREQDEEGGKRDR